MQLSSPYAIEAFVLKFSVKTAKKLCLNFTLNYWKATYEEVEVSGGYVMNCLDLLANQCTASSILPVGHLRKWSGGQ